MAKVSINLYNLWIEVHNDSNYPDQMTDMANRALYLFIEALDHVRKNNLDITKEYEEYGEDDE